MIYTDVGDYAFADLTAERTIKLPVGSYSTLIDLSDEQIAELDTCMNSTVLSPAAQEKLRNKLIEVENIWTRRRGLPHAPNVACML